MTAGGKGACVQLAACVGEQRHRAPFGLVGIQYFLGRGRGGCARRCGGERGKGRDHCQLSNLVRPRGFIVHPSKPPSPRHSQHNLSNLPCCCFPSPVPPSASQSTGQPTQIRFSEVAVVVRQPSQPSHSRPSNHRRNPDKSDPNEPTPWPQTITGSIPTWPLWTSSQRPSPTHHPGHLGPDDLAACAAGLLLSCTGAPTSSTATIQSTPRHDQKPIVPTRRSLFSTSKAFFSLRNLPNSLSFLILRPPPFRCARRVLPCCAALPCAAAILVQDQTPSSCDGSAQSSNHQKPRQPRLSPRLPPTAPRAFVFIVLGIADRCTQGA